MDNFIVAKSEKESKLSPARFDLALEAKQLREFGWTQQQIADTLKVPRRTISFWLKDIAKPIYNGIANIHPNGNNKTNGLATSITLYPTTYENTDGNIPPGSIDLIVTDPPYLVSSENMPRSDRGDLQRDFGIWDKTPQTEYEASVRLWSQLMSKHLKVGGSLYLFMTLTQYHLWTTALLDSGLSSAGEIIWHRVNPAPQIRKTRWCHAFNAILFFTKGTPKTFNWIDQNAMHNVIVGPICGGNERKNHPTQKPLYILEKLIHVSSMAGNVILDPFAGSGSTGFAANRLGRHAILVEPDPLYSGLIQHTANNDFEIKVELRNA